MAIYLSDSESLADLESRIEPEARSRYRAFKHLRVEAAFIDRMYIVYTPTGLHADRSHRPPQILGQIRVRSFTCNAVQGCTAVIEDCETGDLQTIGYVPSLCFAYGFFISIPPFSKLRWDARIEPGRGVVRSMSFGLLFKTQSRAEFYSAGCVMAETPNAFARLYPNTPLNLRHY